jgi:hypothetical protein
VFHSSHNYGMEPYSLQQKESSVRAGIKRRIALLKHRTGSKRTALRLILTGQVFIDHWTFNSDAKDLQRTCRTTSSPT